MIFCAFGENLDCGREPGGSSVLRKSNTASDKIISQMTFAKQQTAGHELK